MFFTCNPVQGAELRANAVSVNTDHVLGVLWRKEGTADILCRSPFPDLTLGTEDAGRLYRLLLGQPAAMPAPQQKLVIE